MDDVLSAGSFRFNSGFECPHNLVFVFSRCAYGPTSVRSLLEGSVDAWTDCHFGFSSCSALCASRKVYCRGFSSSIQKETAYICCQVALEKGRLAYAGNFERFSGSSVMNRLIQSKNAEIDAGEEPSAEAIFEAAIDSENGEQKEEEIEQTDKAKKQGSPRKLIEDEARAVGRIERSVWLQYVHAAGGTRYWSVFVAALVISSLAPVAENGWVKYVFVSRVDYRESEFSDRVWSGAVSRGDTRRSPLSYLTIYALVRGSVCFDEISLINRIDHYRWWVLLF